MPLTSLQFAYKELIAGHHLQVPHRDLRIDSKKSLNYDKKEPLADNLIIHGDNLHALKALLPKYAGRVNCIYIDPPYNTGNEGWAYNDNVASSVFKQWFKKTIDSEDLERHDKWLCMMWPRLQLLRELLADDGIIFVSIDDNEQHHLKTIMDEIWGTENFLADIIWQHRYGRSNNAKLFSNQREHIITYRKSDLVSHIRVKRDDKLNQTYTNPDEDSRGSWISSSYVNPATKEKRPNLVYPIINPHTGIEVNHPTHAWKYSYETYQNHVQENKLWWGIKGNFKYPRLKNFLKESKEKGIVPTDLLLPEMAGTTDEGTSTLQEIFQDDNVDFNNPKPIKLIQNLISIAEGASNKRGIILDSFAGSGTTAHAVIALNREDGGDRKFILVECEDYADTITAERVRRVIGGVPNAKGLQRRTGGSFTYCTMGEAIDIDKMLTGDSMPDFQTLASFLLYHTHAISTEKTLKPGPHGKFYSTDTRDYYLLYEPNVKYLRTTTLTEKMANIISKKGREAIVFAPDKKQSQADLSKLKIIFCRLPDAILTKGGYSND